MASKRPPKRSGPSPRKDRKDRKDGGPYEWFFPQMEAAYSRLAPRGADGYGKGNGRVSRRKVRVPFESRFQRDRGEGVLNAVPMTYWADRFAEYKRRKVAAMRRNHPETSKLPPSPSVPGANNWVPIGPSVVARGQASGRPAVAGRVSGIAVAPGGSTIYVATANGGVWRSDNTGRSWRSLMDDFDNDPTTFASTSLCIGAIAIDQANPQRVYAGTGEGATNALFFARLVNALPSYRGIGPIRSDTGGGAWVVEPTAAGSPTLAGAAFFALAVDPGNAENVVAATTSGLYHRTLTSTGTPEWVQRRTGNHSSVVVARTGATTTFYAAAWGDRVYSSTDGVTWTPVGTSFPTTVNRISLAVQRDNPNVLYALVANTSNMLRGVYRLDGGAGAWQQVTGAPDIVSRGQGDYDLAIAIDPNNANRIYLGGDTQIAGGQWSSTITRCDVTAAGSGYSTTATYIGANVHGDTHVLIHSPGDSNTLWAGGDGGCFVNTGPASGSAFAARNTGLAALCTNYIGMAATEPAIIFAGMQDNGTGRYLGEECWRHVQGGDGGYCVVHWTNPSQVLVYANGTFYRATDGGQDYASWTGSSFPWQVMAEPMVGTPPNPGAPAEADTVALGTGGSIRISTNFGSSFPTTVTLPAGSGLIYSMAFANASRLFVGTTTGRVFRVDNAGGTWTPTRIDNAAGGALGLVGLIADIAIDWSDAARQSIYIALGGNGDFRHVWRYDGTAWQARSGPAGGPNNLLDVEHNAIVVDPDNANHVYVGADIGVWRSTNGGTSWDVLTNGLPDAPVFDLQIHRGARLLRASTHGRGLFEWRLDPPVQADVELYARDTMLDTGRGETTDGRNDPSIWPTGPVRHWLSPNIKVDVPTPAGYQTPTNQIDFFQFNELIVDGSQQVATNVPPPAVHNRVYVEVHNRGRVDASTAQVTVAVTNASTTLPLLPMNYTTSIQAGTNLPGTVWTTLGTVPLTNLRAGYPQIAAFDLPSSILPPPASLPGQSHYCLVAFLHAPVQDPFTSVERNVDLLTVSDRKVAQKNLHLVQFVGTPPPPGTGPGTWAMLDINGADLEIRQHAELVIDARAFDGRLALALPEKLFAGDLKQRALDYELRPAAQVLRTWQAAHTKALDRLHWEAKHSREQVDQVRRAMKLVRDRPLLVARKPQALSVLPGLALEPAARHTVFMRIDPPKGAKIGSRWTFDVFVREPKTGRILGGSTYLVVVNRPAAPDRQDRRPRLSRR